MKPAQPFPLKDDGPETKALLAEVEAAEAIATELQGRYGDLFPNVERDDEKLRGLAQ